jgi:protein-L-isoaspartate(D-aspartate) O-methyltransferase
MGMARERLSEADALIRRLRSVVHDERVLKAMASVPREHFVRRRQRAVAYANAALPIGRGQTISQPLIVARMCELLELGPSDRVLDIGTGSGYHAAVLARLSLHVWSIERHAELSARAAESLRLAGIENVTLVVGEGEHGLLAHAPYDAINVGAAAWHRVPPQLEQQLADGGRLVAPVENHGQRLIVVRREASGLKRRAHEAVRFVPLVES